MEAKVCLRRAIPVSPETEALAIETLKNSMLPYDAILVETDVEEVCGTPRIYFDFLPMRGGITRLYPDTG